MTQAFTALIARHCRSGVIVDAGVLLLYFVGRFSPEQIARFKRTDSFSTDDYKLLCLLLSRFERLLTTPNILAEVSNLSGQIGEPLRTKYFEKLQTEICALHEEYITSREAATGTSFVRFGLTDASIHLLAKGSYLVLTVDFDLYQFLQSQGIDAINFNHLRPYGWTWLAKSLGS